VTVIFLAFASHALEITLETAAESKSRSSTESSLEKLRARSPIVTEEKVVLFVTVAFEDLPAEANALW